MGFQFCRRSQVLGAPARVITIVAAAMLGVALAAASSSAGDLTAQPTDGLEVTNSATKLLPQNQAAEASWLSGLHVSGYASQTFGMWQNPSALRDWTKSRNTLAVSRTLLQVDENYRLNENNTFFAREWFVYEPPYAFNSANNIVGASVANQFLSPTCGQIAPCRTGRLVAPSYGHFNNDLYNNYQVRDVWWENKTGPLTTFVGNQIVVWGQSLAFRIGDVINPQDLLWNFGFANLEQSRNAQWMIHPILNLPELGPFSSNFVEAVIQPGFQPQWWENQFPDGRFTGPGGDVSNGRVATFGEHANGDTRFTVHYDDAANAYDPTMTAVTGIGPYRQGGPPNYITPSGRSHGVVTCNGFAQPPPGKSTRCYLSGVVAGAPFNHTFWECGINAAPFPFHTPANPLRRFGLVSPTLCGLATGTVGGFGVGNIHLSHGNLPFGPAGNFALFNTGPYHIPGMQPTNWNDGIRLHTLVGSTEITALYYNDNVNGGFPQIRFVEPYYTNLMSAFFPDIQEMGITADRPLPVPASISEYFPAVMRAEAVYVNHEAFYDNRPLAFSGTRYSDVVNAMVAIDVDQAYAPWLTSTGNLTAFFELYDKITVSNTKLTPVGALISQRNQKNLVFALASIGTGFFWEDVEPTWTMIYQPTGTTFAMFPTLVLNPPWTKKYFVKLQAIEVLGSNKEQALGLFKGESLLTAQLQYNFNLL
jgi:hypothetical protein